MRWLALAVLLVWCGPTLDAHSQGGLQTGSMAADGLCYLPPNKGLEAVYQATPVSIDWRGRTYKVAGSSWENESAAHKKASTAALKAAGITNTHLLKFEARGVVDVKAVPNGALVATDVGEWGGGVWFFQSGRREPTRIVSENTVGFFELNGRIIALTGIAHLSIDEGELFEIDLSRSVPSSRSFVKLHGAPIAWTRTDGALLIATGDKGFAVLPDGKIESASVKRQCNPI